MRTAEDQLTLTDVYTERTANARKYENMDETKRSVPLVAPEYERGKNREETDSSLAWPREPRSQRHCFGCSQEGETSPRLVSTQNGMNATRPAICYHTTIYIDPATKWNQISSVYQ